MITRLGSDGSLPQRDFTQISATLTGANAATAFVAVRTMAEGAIIYAPTANAAPVGIGPTNTASYRLLNPGDEYKIPNNAGTAVNLANWYAISTSAAATLTV